MRWLNNITAYGDNEIDQLNKKEDIKEKKNPKQQNSLPQSFKMKA